MSAAPEMSPVVPPAPAPLRPFRFPVTQSATLPNGLRLIVLRAPELPVFTFELLLQAGALAEAPEQAGVAQMTAALLDTGAAGLAGDEIARRVDALGLQMDVGANWDIAHVACTGIDTSAAEAMTLFAQLVTAPDFPADEFERVRAQRVAALAQQRGDPGGLASEVALRHAFAPGSTYGRLLMGTQRTLQALTREDTAAFHARRYRPGGAALIAVGNVEMDEVAALAGRAFAGWTGSHPTALADPGTVRRGGVRVVIADRPGAVQSAVRLVHEGGPRNDPRYAERVVLNAILGGMFSSRLNLALRERLGYTYGAHSGWDMRRRGGVFLAATAVDTPTTAATVAEILAQMRALQEQPPAPAELADAKAYLAGSFPLSLETTHGLASRLASRVVFDLPADEYDTYRERILAVTADDVREAARRDLHPERATIAIAGDASRIRGAIESLDGVTVEVINPAVLP